MAATVMVTSAERAVVSLKDVEGLLGRDGRVPTA
jgi:hypothetical protein